jgi:predicted peptidase
MIQQANTLEAQIVQAVHLRYLLFLPRDYGSEPDARWPLVLFLHGAGERGDDLNLVRKHGIPKVVEQRDGFPFIAVSPQCPQDTWWSDHIASLNQLLNVISDSYSVDRDRVYLTGLSLGGYGAWHMAVTYPERFAAVAPICGGGPRFHGFPQRVCGLREVPVWAFHGAKDEVVPPSETETLVKALRECGGDVRCTIYPDADHDSWTRTYDNPEFYAWLLAQKRGAARLSRTG